MKQTIDEFQGVYRWLSNFWPCEVELDGMVFKTVEHAYVAAKTIDPIIREKIQSTEKPGEVKRFGRSMAIRDDWSDIKLQVMESLLVQKFSKGSRLGRNLMATNPSIIVEGNTWGDTFWGVCKGVGENHLGNLLMKIRADLLYAESNYPQTNN